MPAPKWQPEVIEEDTPEPEDHAVATSILALSLKALGQRAIIAAESLFTLVTVFLVFWVWTSIPDPNTHQVVALSIFASFVLAANVIVRKLR